MGITDAPIPEVPGGPIKPPRVVLLKAVLQATVVVLVVLVLGLLTITLLETRGATARLERIAEQNRANGQQIRDCTEPTGQCFRQGQERTAAAVLGITDATVVAVYCAQQDARSVDVIRQCVRRELAK